jgi:hypothetical protein
MKAYTFEGEMGSQIIEQEIPADLSKMKQKRTEEK